MTLPLGSGFWDGIFEQSWELRKSSFAMSLGVPRVVLKQVVHQISESTALDCKINNKKGSVLKKLAVRGGRPTCSQTAARCDAMVSAIEGLECADVRAFCLLLGCVARGLDMQTHRPSKLGSQHPDPKRGLSSFSHDSPQTWRKTARDRC